MYNNLDMKEYERVNVIEYEHYLRMLQSPKKEQLKTLPAPGKSSHQNGKTLIEIILTDTHSLFLFHGLVIKNKIKLLAKTYTIKIYYILEWNWSLLLKENANHYLINS